MVLGQESVVSIGALISDRVSSGPGVAWCTLSVNNLGNAIADHGG